MPENETEEKNPFSEENMFSTENFERETMEEEDAAAEGFINFSEEDAPKDEEEINEEIDKPGEEKGDEEEEAPKDDFNFEDNEEEKGKDEDVNDLDLEAFNKRFNKDFKSEEELADFLKGEDAKEEQTKEEEDYAEAEKMLDFYNPYVEMKDGKYVMTDEEIVEKLFQSEALAENKDLSDEDVQIEIADKIQELKDSRVLDLKAKDIRRDLQDVVNKNLGIKQKIDNNREQARLEKEKEQRVEMQKTFAKFHETNFYGVKLEKQKIGEVYKEVRSGKFLEQLQSDPKALAELALMAAHKDIIFKKSTGLTYNDGIASILDDFKSKEKKSDPMINAQKRGTSGSSDGSKSLIDAILMEKPKEE